MIGWYVHAHGAGHRQRLACIARHLQTPVTALSSLPASDGPAAWVRLPDDLPTGADTDATAGGTLHWAPQHHPGLRARMATIAAWVERERPSLMVVDVSVEVAVLVRAMGVPVVVVAMRGRREDRAHRTAYDLADALLAPWPARLPEPWWPQDWLDKTWHVGALSRFDDRPRSGHGSPPVPGRAAVLWGGDGGAPAMPEVAGWTWDTSGTSGTPHDLWPVLQGADVVVTHGGQNALAEVAAARRPAVVLPQDRPYGEQHANAAALAGAGLAVVVDRWPEAADWPGLLQRACALPDRWEQWSDGRGAQRAATRLDELAATLRERGCAGPGSTGGLQ